MYSRVDFMQIWSLNSALVNRDMTLETDELEHLGPRRKSATSREKCKGTRLTKTLLGE